jgi:Xaa-Pro aminopeptidase
MTANEKIAQIRERMKANGIAAVIIPSADPHMSEYFSDHWKTRVWVSGFTGSAGTYVITEKMAGLWTDGRYYVQAERQLEGSEGVLFKASEPETPKVYEYLAKELPENAVVGINGQLFSAAYIKTMEEAFQKKNIKIDGKVDYANELWEDRPAESATEVYNLPVQYAGKSTAEKLKELREKLKEQEADAIAINTLDGIAWLYNIRANDVACTPVAIAYAYVSQEEAILFTNTSRVGEDVLRVLSENGVTMRSYESVFDYVAGIKNPTAILCDEKEMNYGLYHTMQSNENVKLVSGKNPVALMKAMKNEVETKNTYEAYLQDGIAEAEFYGWLFETLEQGETITEYQAAEKLYSFREQREHFKGDSFTAIIAYKDNAAMMHYAPKAEGSAVIERSNLLLNDSGGQYLTGTTDTTRTFAMGPLTDEERRDYTLTLKSVIALSSAVFKEGMTGYGLDILSRGVLWKYGLDYRCGTGHGVGYLLNVHEGPQSLGNREVKLQPGMVLTIEPGVYTEGSHGVRIENTAVVAKGEKTEYGQFLHFETFTVVPIDTTPLKLDMMSQEEIDWLNDFNRHAYETVAPHVSERAEKWLKKATAPISK